MYMSIIITLTFVTSFLNQSTIAHPIWQLADTSNTNLREESFINHLNQMSDYNNASIKYA